MSIEEVDVRRSKSMIQDADDVHRACHDEGGGNPVDGAEDQTSIIPLIDAFAQDDGTEVLFSHQASEAIEALQGRTLVDGQEVIEGS